VQAALTIITFNYNNMYIVQVPAPDKNTQISYWLPHRLLHTHFMGVMTFGITTLVRMTLAKSWNWEKYLLSLGSVTFFYCHDWCSSGDCHYTDCHYTECRIV